MTEKNNRQQFWQKHLIKHQQSGLSGIQYCQQEQLAYHCFIYWRRKLKTHEVSFASTHAVENATGFTSVLPSSPATGQCHDALELSLPNGLVIGNIHTGNLKWVRRLLESLS